MLKSLLNLNCLGRTEDDPVPTPAKAIFNAYGKPTISVLEQFKSRWTDATPMEKDDMYGEMWKRGYTLTSLIFHHIHHHGQIIVLMRQAAEWLPFWRTASQAG